MLRRALVVILLVAAACDAYGTSETPAPDGGTTTDASTPTTDAATSADAGTDAHAEAACERVIDDHFPTSISASWTTTKTSGSTLSHDPSTGAGALGSLKAMVSSDTGTAEAQVEQERTPVPRAVTLSFAMNVASTSSGYAEVGCTLQFLASADAYLSLNAELADGNLSLDDNARLDGGAVATSPGISVGALAVGTWHRIVFRVTDVKPTGAHAELSFEGNVWERELVFPAPPTILRVKCGVDFADPGSAFVVLVDDVTLDRCE